MDNEIPASSFIRIGQSLEMHGEIDNDQLKRVPKRNTTTDVRRQFFIDNANSKKYYYMPIDDVPQHPHRNTLVPLGTFLGFINLRGQVPVLDDQYYNNDNHSYFMRFSNYPYNSTENWNGPIGMDIHTLVYTDEPPVAGSVPLTYMDYLEQFHPGRLAEMAQQNIGIISGDGVTGFGVSITGKRGGKKTKKHKKYKKYRTNGSKKVKKSKKHKSNK